MLCCETPLEKERITMKVIHFNDFRHYAGAETAVQSLIESHKAMGVRCRLVTKSELGSYLTTPDFARRRKCERIFSEENPDVVHVHNALEMGLIPVEVALEKGVPVVWTFHDYKGICPNTLMIKQGGTVCEEPLWCESCDRSRHVTRFDYPSLYKLLKRTTNVAISDFMKKAYSGRADMRRIYWDADPKILELQAEGEDEEDFSILFAGRRDPEKGVSFALAALKRILRDYPKAKMIFAGKTREIELMRIAKAYGVEDSILDYGYLPREEYLQVMLRAKVALCPSIWAEPFNLSLLEAMSAGKPVIATRVGGQAEVVGDAGIVIEPKSSADIQQAVVNLFNNPEKMRQVGEACRERARKFKGCAEEYLKLYKEAIANAPAKKD